MEIEKLVRKNILALKPYSSARDEFKGDASVFLDANENPFPSAFNRYPDPHQLVLKKRISELKKISVQNIFIGNGSDEPIDLLIRAFCEPGQDEVIIPQPTYGMYQVSADINNIGVKSVPLTAHFDLDVDAITKAGSINTKILFLCSPNNPSGNVLATDKIEALLKSFKGIVVVDEAYIDFVTAPSFVQQLATYPNLVVLQTLSKAWGMAALRVGLCFASEFIISVLNKIKPPYNLSGIAQEKALELLLQEDRKNQNVNAILSERTRLIQQLSTLNAVIKVFPSDANFVLVKVKGAKRIYNALMNSGIIVRDRSNVLLCDDCLRITIGTAIENDTLIKALTTL